MAESEVGFRPNANQASNCIFQLLYDAVIVRDAQIEFDATGVGDRHAAGLDAFNVIAYGFKRILTT